MSNLDVHVWVHRSRGLVGGRVDNVYALGDAVYLKLRAGGDVKFLALEAGVRAHATSRVSGLGEAFRGFPSVVRRYLRDRRIDGVEQLGFDRVLRFTFSGGVELYVELLPRGFMVLVGGGKVVAASRYAELRDRVVKPGVQYKPPPLQTVNPFELSFEELASRSSVGVDVVRGLVKGVGLPGEVAEEVLFRAGLKPDLDPRALDLGVYRKVWEELGNLYRESLEGRGYLVLKEGVPFEATPFKPRRAVEDSVKVFESFDEALDELFSSRALVDDKLVREEISKLERSLRDAEELESRYRAEATARRLEAEVLARNYEAVDSIVECVRRSWRLRGASRCSNVVEVEYGSGVYYVDLEGVRVKLNYGEGVQDAIVRLYREAGELEGKARRAREAVVEALGRLSELELKAKARAIALKARTRRTHWFERFRWTVTSNGFLVVGGRDASQNESLVRRYLEDRDIFLHADIQGGSAVIVKTQGREPSGGDVEDAAVIAACYSRAWKAGLASIDVYWVYGSQVSKSAPPGEYLRTGAFMVYGERNYIRGVKLALALGLTLDSEGNPVAFVGSERVVERVSIAYATLIPGDNRLDEAELVKEELVKTLDSGSKPLAMALEVEQIKALIPGRFRILRVKPGEGAGLEIL